MTELALLGTIALRTFVTERLTTGRVAEALTWDADAMRIANDQEANRCVNPPYREGWTLPTL